MPVWTYPTAVLPGGGPPRRQVAEANWHVIAINQLRLGSEAHAYYRRKRPAGKGGMRRRAVTLKLGAQRSSTVCLSPGTNRRISPPLDGAWSKHRVYIGIEFHRSSVSLTVR